MGNLDRIVENSFCFRYNAGHFLAWKTRPDSSTPDRSGKNPIHARPMPKGSPHRSRLLLVNIINGILNGCNLLGILI